MKYKRIFLLVIDSLGIGPMPDAAAFGDAGAATLPHISEAAGELLHIPTLLSLGLGQLCPLQAPTVPNPACDGLLRTGSVAARLLEASLGKDTMTGHWEMMGLLTKTPFLTFTETGFPPELIQALEQQTGHRVIGNKAASGTAILDELGEREIATGDMIVYTSGDSVLQICGNEETFGLSELYRCCEIARELTLQEEFRVGRVIARPYVGKRRGEFQRTPNRRDYALNPTGKTVLDALQEGGFSTIGVGKIHDIFNGQGIDEALHSDSSVQGMEQTIDLIGRDFTGLCFVNLVDFDALWGHRRDAAGYARELTRFDEKLSELLPKLRADDLLLITADHGNDPTYTGTDHTREMTPLLCWSPGRTQEPVLLPDRESFGDIGAAVAANFSVSMPEGTVGTSIPTLFFNE